MQHRNGLFDVFVDRFVRAALNVLLNQCLEFGPKADFHVSILIHQYKQPYASYSSPVHSNPNSRASTFHFPSTSARVFASITISSGHRRVNPSVRSEEHTSELQ